MLTARVQYALVFLKEVSLAEAGVIIRLKDVVDKHQINLDLLEQVARTLRAAGLIESVRGPGGGYKAGHNLTPSLLQVMQAVEPTKGLKLAVSSAEGSELILSVYNDLLKKLEQ